MWRVAFSRVLQSERAGGHLVGGGRAPSSSVFFLLHVSPYLSLSLSLSSLFREEGGAEFAVDAYPSWGVAPLKKKPQGAEAGSTPFEGSAGVEALPRQAFVCMGNFTPLPFSQYLVAPQERGGIDSGRVPLLGGGAT
jgi:hypothetical protein